MKKAAAPQDFAAPFRLQPDASTVLAAALQ
jgi:hypothetical protein